MSNLLKKLSKYPRIGNVEKHPRNTSERCLCGAMAKYRVEIQVNFFRGDDEIEWRCQEHKRSIEVNLTEVIWRS